MPFELISKFKPTGDQPQAIKKLAGNLQKGVKNQVLLGVTGSGKTFTIASLVERVQKPLLIISPNKTLAAQLYQEFKEFFPHNAIHYFVSYYDYYQPEAYIPQTNTYIEKDAKINKEIDKLRHAAIQDLLNRKDTIIISSVSCIYNIGSPENYQKVSLKIRTGQTIKRRDFINHLNSLQYQRNNLNFQPGTFRVRGDSIEIYLVTGEYILQVEFFGDRIEKIFGYSPLDNSGSSKKKFLESFRIYPAKFWVAPQEKLDIAIENIKEELGERLKVLKKSKKDVEAERLAQRTNYDLEMIKETGYCHGIENYSRDLEFREPGDPPFTLLDYFKKSPGAIENREGKSDYIICIDESHLAIPQLHAMYNNDRARKETLIKHGFRLPSALDNRPLSFKEFEQKAEQIVYSSATPGKYEKEKSRGYIIEQLIRPTGLLEPKIEIRPIKNQIKDLVGEIKKRIKKGQRSLAITLTKRMAEELANYLQEQGIKTQYLHSEVKTLERPKIIEKLRKGEYDVLVGINLLREGLDLPEVSLVGILDADKEGFLRNETTLIQTMGRVARHIDGKAILYAEKKTYSMEKAIQEIERRRKFQIAYNEKHHLTPKPIIKPIRTWLFGQKGKETSEEFGVIKDIKLLKTEMVQAAKNLEFERAANLRDLIKNLQANNNKNNTQNAV